MDIRFSYGQVTATPRALERIGVEAIRTGLLRHITGDWGLVPEADKAANEVGLKERNRVLSAYEGPDGTRFWIITEWPHPKAARTTVLLPEEY